MPEFSDIVITRKDAANVNVSVYEITGKLIDNGVVVADYTGPNARRLPQDFSTLTFPQQQELYDSVHIRFLEMISGVGQ